MTSRAGSRPRTRGNRANLPVKVAVAAPVNLPHGTAARPLTRARQRGYYSEIAGLHAAEHLGVSIVFCSSIFLCSAGYVRCM